MNKSEKLLAARKRLKEFQLSKKSHVSESPAKDADRNTAYTATAQTNDNARDSDIEVNSRTEIASENHIESTNNFKASNTDLPIFEAPDSTECKANCDSSLSETDIIKLPNADRFFQDTVDHSEIISSDEFNNFAANVTPYAENSFKQIESAEDALEVENQYTVENVLDKSNTVYRQTQPEMFFKDEEIGLKDSQTEARPEQSNTSDDYTSLFGSHALQKEYLLQMTSAVTNVLSNDDLDTKDIPLDLNHDLEHRNQFLATSLQQQKEIANRLQLEVSQYKTRNLELETLLATKDADFEAKLYRELNPLKEQLHLHAQTTGILVGEKAELTAALVQSQMTTKQKIAEVEELNGKLKAAQIQIHELERELNFVKNNSESAGRENDHLQSSYDALENKYSKIKQEKDDYELETAELKQKLNMKNNELMNVQQELKEKTALLSLNELRLQQMTSSTQETSGVGEQHHVVAALEQQLSQLMETLKSVSSERDEASSHYQNYVQQLNAQVTGLASQLEQTAKENSEISSREQSLIQRLSDLECQIQSQKELPKPPPPVIDDNKERISELVQTLDQITTERDSLQATLYQRDADIDALKQEVEGLQEMRNSNAEASRLVSALEGERLAAARAVSQNQELKQQLSEMQDAFVQLSNDKLDLTEKLQGERAIGMKLNARLNNTEDDVYKLKEEIQRKDLLLAELEKEKLHSAQIADQMQHYQAQSHHANTLQQELHNAQEMIESLTKQNQQLINKANEEKKFHQSTDANQSFVESEIKHDFGTVKDLPEDEADLSTTATQTELHSVEDDNLVHSSDQDTPTITPEAVRKLEERFKHTMEQVAELSDEKQRLEHLVLQLQSETETIGEYVTLYQKQRGVLQERAKEKEEAFRRLSEQRNQQQEQLHKLKMLVAELIQEKGILTAAIDKKDVNTESETEVASNEEIVAPAQVEATVVTKDTTTSQILDLLTEIKECKDTCALEPNFHPCPWCSGKLITV